MLLGYWVPALAASGAPTLPEEVVVYGDRFARWDDTRFQVHNEVTLPAGLLLSDGRGDAFAAQSWQLTMQLHCHKGEPQLWGGLEIACVLSDVTLLATSLEERLSPREHLLMQRVLEHIDSRLTGAALQLQVSAAGTVPNIDLEGIDSDNSAERRERESMRQLLSLAIAGFSLQQPLSAPSEWIEYHSALMDLPNPTASRGSSTTVHRAVQTDSERRVTSLSEGTTALPLTGSLSGEVMLSMTGRSEARFRLTDGVMTHRQWTVQGTPTASSSVRDPCAISGDLLLLDDAPEGTYESLP